VKPKFLDIVVILAAASLTAASAVYAYTGGGELRVVVRSGGRQWVYPLSAQATVAVAGALGETVLRIADGSVRVESSPCPNQTCVAAGPVHRRGTWLACLPNEVIVTIEGNESAIKPKEDGIDAFAW
jgi:hypothetical protein